jgi:hypothetical protein
MVRDSASDHGKRPRVLSTANIPTPHNIVHRNAMPDDDVQPSMVETSHFSVHSHVKIVCNVQLCVGLL